MKIRTSLALILASLATAACSSSDSNPAGPGNSNDVVSVSGDAQTGIIGVRLSTPLTVSVQNSTGTGLAGQSVSWSVTDSAGPGASVSLQTTMTGTDGTTSVALTLGSAEGAYTVTAAIPGDATTFSATAVASLPPSLESDGGDGQVGFAGELLAEPLQVKVVDSFGNPVAGATVSFAVTSGAGAQVDLSAVSNQLGVASAGLTLGPTNGSYGAMATLGSETVPFQAYGCGGDGSVGTLALAPGQDTVLVGTDLNCVQLPAHSAGEEYEIVATMAPDGFLPTPFRIEVNGRGASTSLRRPLLASVPSAADLYGENALVGGTIRGMGLQYAWDMRLRELEMDMAGLPKTQPGFQLLAAPPTVGDQRTFQASCTSEPNVAAEAVSVGSEGVIYEDLIDGGGFFSTAAYDSIVAEFDTIVFPTDTLYFGAPLDFDDNQRVIILVTTAVNALTTGSYDDPAAGFVAGYFCPADVVSGFGNDAEMFYIVAPDPDGEYNGGGGSLTTDEVRQIMINVIAHEFQHLINNQTGPPFPTGGASEIWINEGLSHLAEEVNGHAVTGLMPGSSISAADFISQVSFDDFSTWYAPQLTNLNTYLSSPTDSATLVQQQDPAQVGDGLGSFRMRGANWMFVRYLLDRYATPATEAQVTRQLIGSTGGTRAALASLFGQPFEDLVSDYNSMLTATDRPDLGVTFDPALELTSYQLRDVIETILTAGWALRPRIASLGFSTAQVSELYPGSSQFMTLVAAAATGGTGVRFSLGDGGDIGSDKRARMRIVRTK